MSASAALPAFCLPDVEAPEAWRTGKDRESRAGWASVDETYVPVAGAWAYVYCAGDGQGQIAGVFVSAQRAAEDAAAFFRRAIEAASVAPTEVTTVCAAGSPPALAAALLDAAYEAGKRVQQRIERDH